MYPRPLKQLFGAYFKTGQPLLATHRGHGKMGPVAENTLEAFEAGCKKKFKAHELDVRVTRDNIPVLFHGPQLERTTSGSGRVEKQNWKEIQKLDWGHYLKRNNPRAPKKIVKPAVLGEYLRRFHKKVFTNIELKRDLFVWGFNLEKTVLQTVEPYMDKSALLFSSFSIVSLMYLRVKNPRAAVGLLIDKGPFALLKMRAGILLVKPDSIHLHRTLASPERIHKLKKRGYGILVWGANTPEMAHKLARAGVDILVTDNMNMQNEYKKWKPEASDKA